MIKSILKKPILFVFLFFLAYLIAGLLIYKDYGVFWDEPVQIAMGEVNYQYIKGSEQALLNFTDKYYGPIFEIFLTALSKITGKTGYPDLIYLRHLIVFLLFFVGVFFFYLLVKNYFNSWKLGLLGGLFLILSPRIFADSFYNSKDIAFLALFIICIYTLINFDQRVDITSALIHGLACAILIDIRMPGIFIPCLTFLMLILGLFSKPAIANSEKVRRLFIFGLFGITTLCLTIAMFPISWRDPLRTMFIALRLMGRYLPWNQQVLYLGNYIKARNLPWHYIPVWILITTPLFYSFNFFAGFVKSTFAFLRGTFRVWDQRWKYDFLVLSWFFLPLFSVIIGRSVLYDGWRHMFFIYPAFIILALIGWTFILDTLKSSKIPGILAPGWGLATIIACGFVLEFMIANHPFQNVYFNQLAGKNMESVKQDFDMDYWGLSYRQALEYILDNDSAQTIPIHSENLAGNYNQLILPANEAKRIKFVSDVNEARYFISNYRWHRQEYDFSQEVFSVKVGGVKIMVAYKLK